MEVHSDQAEQYMSWIHRGDWLAWLRWMITMMSRRANQRDGTRALTNAEFSREGSVERLGDRDPLPAPRVGLRLLLGEMATHCSWPASGSWPRERSRLGFSSVPQLGPALHALLS